MDRAIHIPFGEFEFGLRHIEGEKYEVVDFRCCEKYMKVFKGGEWDHRYVEFQYQFRTEEHEKDSRTLLAVNSLATGWVMNATGTAEESYGEGYEEEEKEEILVNAGGKNGAADGYHFQCTW